MCFVINLFTFMLRKANVHHKFISTCSRACICVQICIDESERTGEEDDDDEQNLCPNVCMCIKIISPLYFAHARFENRISTHILLGVDEKKKN